MTNSRNLGILMLLVLWCVPAMGQEQPSPGTPIPAQPAPGGQQTPGAPGAPQAPTAQPTAPPTAGGDQAVQPEQTPERTPLDSFAVASIEPARVGPGLHRPRYVNALLSFSEQVDTNPAYVGTPVNGYEYTSNVAGTVTFERRRRYADFMLNYSGGGLIHKQNSDLDSSYHSLVTDLSWVKQRWHFVVRNETSYTPESPFGFSGFAGGTAAGLASSLLPSQSILSVSNRQVSSTAAGQIEYSASPHTSFTFMGNYGVLRFLDLGLVDSDQYSAGMGFNKELSRRDTIALQYNYSNFKFLEQLTTVDTHSWTLMYRHRLGERLSFELDAGPQITELGGLAALGPLSSQLDSRLFRYTAGGSLAYHRNSTTISLSALHGTTGGSGVFQGADTTTTGVSLRRTFRRGWTIETGGGYARNQLLITPPGTPLTTYNTEYGKASVSRAIGRHVNAFVSYNVQNQDLPVAGCVGLACNNGLRHVFTAGFDWHYRPSGIGIE